jgi:hypothetical protein
MTNIKQASAWWVALLHALFTYIAAILLVVIIIPALGVGFSALAPGFDLEAFGLTTKGTVVVMLIGLLFLWWAVTNSAKILRRKYAVTDKRTLLYGSTVIYLALGIASSLLLPAETGATAWEFVSIALGAILFFLVTKKYFTSN